MVPVFTLFIWTNMPKQTVKIHIKQLRGTVYFMLPFQKHFL